MAITRIGNPAIADQRGVNFRNIIINGDQSIAQRSTSTSSANTSAYHCTDRWNNVGMSIGTWTISQSTDVPTGQGFAKSLKYDCTTAEASPSAGDQLHLSQRIEGQNLQYLLKGTSSAKSLTLSFWVKTNKTGTYQVNLRDKDNTRIIGKTYAVSSADTWEKKILTFAGDTTGAFDNDNASSLECEWFLGAGSTYTSGAVPTSWEAESAGDRAAGLTVNLGDSTSNEWYITGVQLEAGQVASDFEFLPHDVNFQRCLRYYEAMGITTGGRNDTNRVDAWCQFKVKKRSEAYSASVDTSGGNEIASVGIESHDISSLHSTLSKQFNGAYLRINTDNDFTAGQPLSCYLGSTAIRIDDEL
jgi:hypothetical protein